MATSRYDTAADSAAAANTGKTDTTSGTGNTSGAGTTSSTSTNNSTQKTNTTNMDPKALASLNLLIQQLMNGGTQQQQLDQAQRQSEIGTVKSQRGAYTGEAAMVDAQGLIAQTLRQALEQSLPSLTRAVEGAGTSGNALGALLTQDASVRASQAASAQGVAAKTNYGGIFSSLSGVLEQLTKPNDAVTNALLNALQIAKGAITNSVTQTTGTTNTTGTSTNETNNSANQTQVSTPIPIAGSRPAANVQYWGPTETAAEAERRIAATPTANSDILNALASLHGNENYTGKLTF